MHVVVAVWSPDPLKGTRPGFAKAGLYPTALLLAVVAASLTLVLVTCTVGSYDVSRNLPVYNCRVYVAALGGDMRTWEQCDRAHTRHEPAEALLAQDKPFRGKCFACNGAHPIKNCRIYCRRPECASKPKHLGRECKVRGRSRSKKQEASEDHEGGSGSNQSNNKAQGATGRREGARRDQLDDAWACIGVADHEPTQTGLTGLYGWSKTIDYDSETDETDEQYIEDYYSDRKISKPNDADDENEEDAQLAALMSSFVIREHGPTCMTSAGTDEGKHAALVQVAPLQNTDDVNVWPVVRFHSVAAVDEAQMDNKHGDVSSPVHDVDEEEATESKRPQCKSRVVARGVHLRTMDEELQLWADEFSDERRAYLTNTLPMSWNSPGWTMLPYCAHIAINGTCAFANCPFMLQDPDVVTGESNDEREPRDDDDQSDPDHDDDSHGDHDDSTDDDHEPQNDAVNQEQGTSSKSFGFGTGPAHKKQVGDAAVMMAFEQRDMAAVDELLRSGDEEEEADLPIGNIHVVPTEAKSPSIVFRLKYFRGNRLLWSKSWTRMTSGPSSTSGVFYLSWRAEALTTYVVPREEPWYPNELLTKSVPNLLWLDKWMREQKQITGDTSGQQLGPPVPDIHTRPYSRLNIGYPARLLGEARAASSMSHPSLPGAAAFWGIDVHWAFRHAGIIEMEYWSLRFGLWPERNLQLPPIYKEAELRSVHKRLSGFRTYTMNTESVLLSAPRASTE
eukprot:g5417.t1